MAQMEAPPQHLNIAAAAKPGYLGSAAVVERLVRDFYGRVLMANAPEDLRAACASLADVFMGMDPAYQPVGGWAGMGGLSQVLGERLHVKVDQFEGEVLQHAFARLATEALGIAKAYRDGPAERQLDRLIHYTVCLLVGTADVEYPGGLGWKQGPARR